jgi:hypothetical protein
MGLENEAEMSDDAIFVTGAQRSGTTLLQKLLDAQDHISLLSQPFPLLFVEVKRAFLNTLGDEDPLPLGHLFLERRYTSHTLTGYLRDWRTCRSDLLSLFERMDSYSGQYTRFPPKQLEEALSYVLDSDDFVSIVAKLERHLALAKGTPWVGSKETLCEEFVPTLLERGFRCVIIIRDPRDVVASLNHGRGQEFGGLVKPTLLNVRNWRKSIAFALAMETQPGFHWCLYEDLVENPVRELSRLAAAIGIERVFIPHEIRDSGGIVWRGNSSHHEHEGVVTSSVGAYRHVLPHEVSEFVEAACLPELLLLGYETALTREAAVRVLTQYREPYEIKRAGTAGDAATPINLAFEAQRLERVTQPVSDESELWFLFSSVHARLRKALRP